jgi:hypothetical protein
MKRAKLMAALAAAALLTPLLLPPSTAEARGNKSGCKGKVGRLTAFGGVANVYEWPDRTSRVVTTVRTGDPAFWVYRDYEGSDFYLVSVCARSAGADCVKRDNTDPDPANDPLVGFMERRAVDTLSGCHEHKPPLPKGGHRKAASKKFRAGRKFVVCGGDLYLRSVEPGNSAHPYGLLREGDVFVEDYIKDGREWMYGWALSGSRGVDPKMRYGVVLYRESRYLKLAPQSGGKKQPCKQK